MIKVIVGLLLALAGVGVMMSGSGWWIFGLILFLLGAAMFVIK